MELEVRFLQNFQQHSELRVIHFRVINFAIVHPIHMTRSQCHESHFGAEIFQLEQVHTRKEVHVGFSFYKRPDVVNNEGGVFVVDLGAEQVGKRA